MVLKASPEAVLAARERLLLAAEDGRLEAIAERHGLDLVTLHGSAVDPDSAPRDLDVAVRFRRDVQREVLALYVDLQELVGIDELDLMNLNSASVLARSRALGHGAIGLFEDEPGRWAKAQMAAMALDLEERPLRLARLRQMADQP